jgi:hypothetical protein
MKQAKPQSSFYRRSGRNSDWTFPEDGSEKFSLKLPASLTSRNCTSTHLEVFMGHMNRSVKTNFFSAYFQKKKVSPFNLIA